MKSSERRSKQRGSPGQEVLRARRKLGLSQPQFARILETPLGTIRGWEQERREPPPCALLLLRLLVENPELAASLSQPEGAAAESSRVKRASPRDPASAKAAAHQAPAQLHQPGEDADFWLL